MHRLPSRLECAAEAAARHVPVNRPCPASAGNAEPRVYPRVRARGVPLLVVATIVLLCARALPAQAIGQGFELERAGQYDQAAAIYLAPLRAEPTNLSALLGLERVLPPINRLGELLPSAQRAPAASRCGRRRAACGTRGARGAGGPAGCAGASRAGSPGGPRRRSRAGAGASCC